MNRFVAPAVLLLIPMVAGCSTIGPRALRADQVAYGRALGEAKKRQILSTMVGLRFADSPSFLEVTQIIAAYQFEATGGTTVNSRPDPGGSIAQATGMLSYANHPTFTFTPTTGEAYAAAYIRPLAPTLILPLAEGGIPVDLLLRITAQSIGEQQNGTMLGGKNASGTPGFFEILQVMRRLQLDGVLTVEYREVSKVGKVYLNLSSPAGPPSPDIGADLERLRRLAGLDGEHSSYEVVYGQGAAPGQIRIITRSVLAILSDLGGEIPVPDAEIVRGATKPTVTLVGGETRPTILVHVGRTAPASAYVSIGYGSDVYWIDNDDFDSKYAFTVLQNVMALANATVDTKAPIVTIPAS